MIDFYLNKIEFYFSKKQDEEMPAKMNSDDSDEDMKHERSMSSIQEDDAEDQDESRSP